MFLFIERLNNLSLPHISESISFKETILQIAEKLEPDTTIDHFADLFDFEMRIGSKVFGGDYSDSHIHLNELFSTNIADLRNSPESFNLKRALHETRVQLNNAESEINGLHGTINGLHGTINDLRTSISWRISLPIRVLGRTGKKLLARN
jgi:hypothetical protein